MDPHTDKQSLVQGVEDVLKALSSTQNPELILNLVVVKILKEEPPALQALIRLGVLAV